MNWAKQEHHTTMQNQRISKFWLYAIAVLICGIPGSVSAQLNDEMRDLFREIADHVDPDLKHKFEQAIVRNSDLIELTPDQFRRFRDHPINPFDGIQDIDPNQLKGNIELKFELPSLRERVPCQWERQQPELLATLTAVARDHRRSIVQIYVQGKPVVMGVVIDDRGYVMTKASELERDLLVSPQTIVDVKPQVQTWDGRLLSAQIRRSDENNDVALLFVKDLQLPAIAWSDREPTLGEFFVTLGAQSEVVALGTYSNPPRSLLGREQGFLGISPESHPSGVTLREVTPGGAGYLAGLRAGDVVTKINGKSLNDVSELVNEIRRLRPGSVVDISILRGTRSQHIQAILAGRNMSSDQAARFKMMNRLGALPSRRNTEFAWVLQHDTPLLPEQCGGPIVDLRGNVIGLNIARQGRVASLAIPAAHAQKIAAELLQPSALANSSESITK